MKQSLVLIILATFFISCATKKEIIYFQDLEELNNTDIQQAFEPLIEQNDILFISISSIDDAIVKPFNRQTGLEGTVNNSNPDLNGYLVNADGLINFPVLGKMVVANKTRGEVEEMLTRELREYVKDVVVDVRIMNFKITVLGEVEQPGVYTIKNQRVTLPEALGLAGDLTDLALRDQISIIREEGGKRVVTTVDITQTDFFTGPFYFLKQNDVVYVQPSQKGVKKSGFIPDVPALLSLFTVILSTVIIISR